MKNRPPELGIAPACAALGLSRATFYRRPLSGVGKAVSASSRRAVRRLSPRAQTPAEREAVLAALNSPRFVDCAPATVYAVLLDEGQYLGSIRTFYRLLAANQEIRERRQASRRPTYSKPELKATGPNQVWSWDITKLRGPVKWCYYYLYVVIDIFSRYVVGWLVATKESAGLAQRLIAESAERQGIAPAQLTLHADCGSVMKAKEMSQLMADLGITESHSRPHVSDDNPYSESQFKTLKYAPDFPGTFASLFASQDYGRQFFAWYNDEHRHSALGLMTPAMVHYGQSAAVQQQRATVLEKAYQLYPERFVKGLPKPPALAQEVWINKPQNLITEGQSIPMNNVNSKAKPAL